MCLRILILEDYAPLRRVLAVTLQRAGCQVTLARSAWEALRVLEQHACDTLVVDMDMANGESWGVLRALDPVRHPISIVVLLNPEHGEWQELESCGVRVVLLKPVGKEALLSGIKMTWRDTGRTSSGPIPFLLPHMYIK